MINYSKKVCFFYRCVQVKAWQGVGNLRGMKSYIILTNMVFLILAHVISNNVILIETKELACIRIELTLLNS